VTEEERSNATQLFDLATEVKPVGVLRSLSAPESCLSPSSCPPRASKLVSAATMGPRASDHLTKALEALRAHDAGDTLAEAVCAGLLEVGAEPAGEPEEGLADRLAKEAKLSEDERGTKAGDPLSVLENGPKDDKDVALLEAALAHAVGARLDGADADDRREIASELLNAFDGLEAWTAVSAYRGLAAALEGEQSDLLWDEVAAGLIRGVGATPAKESPADARRRELLLTVRASALCRAPEGARAVLAGRLAADMPVGAVKRVALAALAGVDDVDAESAREAGRDPAASVRAATASRAPKLDGALEGKPWGPVTRILAALTGILLVRWLVLVVMRYLLRFRRSGTLVVGASTVKVVHETRLLGRVIRSGETSYSLRSVHAATLEARFPYLHLLVGALALVIGGALGVNFIVEGSCAAYPPLALFGVAVIGGGLVLDILLEVLVPARPGVSTLIIDMGRKWVRLRGVDDKRAGELVAALEKLLPEPTSKRRSPKR